MNIWKRFNELMDSHLLVIVTAIIVGVLFADVFIQFSTLSTVILGGIFFLSSLKIDLSMVRKQLTDVPMLIVVNVFMLFLLPAGVYFLVKSIYPAMAIPLMLLAAMPAGMTAPLLAEISGGKQSLALVLTVTTSLLAPFTVPLVVKLLAGAVVEVSAFEMFITLAKVIFIPFVLAQFIRFTLGSVVEKTQKIFKPISVLLLALLIAVVISKQAGVILDGIYGGEALGYLAVLGIFFLFLHVAGYFAIFWRSAEDRVTITVCLTYMNFTLAIVLADTFFVDSAIVVPVVLSVIPWALFLVPYKFTMRKLGFVKV